MLCWWKLWWLLMSIFPSWLKCLTFLFSNVYSRKNWFDHRFFLVKHGSMVIRGGTNSSSSLGTLRTPPDFFEQNLSPRAYSRGKCLKIPLCMLGRNRYLRYYQFGNTNQERFSFYIYRLRAPRPRIGSPAQFSTRAFLILAIKKPWYQYCKGPMVPSTLEAYCF